jgi:hypothetical protein
MRRRLGMRRRTRFSKTLSTPERAGAALGRPEYKRLRFAGPFQSPLTDSNRRPPPYHGTPSATGRNPRQPFSPAFAVSALPRFATDCHWLQPRGSIKAPSFVVCSGDASARRGDSRRSALGRLLTALDRPTTLCATTGRMRFSRIPPCSSPRPPRAGSSASSRVFSSLYPVVVALARTSWLSGSPAPSRRASCSRWAGVALISLG